MYKKGEDFFNFLVRDGIMLIVFIYYFSGEVIFFLNNQIYKKKLYPKWNKF